MSHACIDQLMFSSYLSGKAIECWSKHPYRLYKANLINERINLNLFKKSTSQIIVDIKNYSLTERFQLSENIKTCKSFNNVVLSILIFNLICICSFAIESFDVTNLIKNISNIVLCYSILMYGFTMPLVMLYHNEQWQNELKRLSRKVSSSTFEAEVFVKYNALVDKEAKKSTEFGKCKKRVGRFQKESRVCMDYHDKNARNDYMDEIST
nr:7TM GPCR domain containing protein [Haemonchus contortus]